MKESRRPIFWFLWPRIDPHAPTDERAVQMRLVRVAPRGPVRIGLLIAASIATVLLLVTAVLTVTSSGITLGALLGSALAATMLALSLRGWVVGTYVNDAGIVIETTFRRTSLPWEEIASITLDQRASPLLGLPLPLRTSRVAIHLLDGQAMGTHVYGTSPDLCCRPDALDMAHLRLLNWWERA